MSDQFQVTGKNAKALFTLKLHRGEGMLLVAMNWKKGKPPQDFVGFAIEYKEPQGQKFFALKNRLAFPGLDGSVNPNQMSTRLSPIQKFRWVHFPRNAELAGDFTYSVTPVFMNDKDVLSYGEPQQAAIALRRETYPGKLNVAFTRGFVSSQAFVDKYGAAAIPKLLPAKADAGLEFVPSLAQAADALTWMGFEARSAILEVLDQGVADSKAQVRLVVYDFNLPEILSRLKNTKLKGRVKVIIDDSGDHGAKTSAETSAFNQLSALIGAENIKRQHMGNLQHNKMVVVQGPKTNAAVVGSTNHSWRGFFVQNNNAIVLNGKDAVKLCMQAFDNYFAHDDVAGFSGTDSAVWNDLKLKGIDAQINFSPRSDKNAVLQSIGDDVARTTSSLFFSLAFLYQTKGPIRDAIKKLQQEDKIFSYGISDREVGGLDVATPDGKVVLVEPQALSKNLPQPFKAEPTGGGGVRLHHKFVVIDFDQPAARVYMGSFNFSGVADTSNGENLLLIRNRRVATSYMIEAVRLFDHYEFRDAQAAAKSARKPLQLQKPPRQPGEQAWFDEDYTNARKIKDRELFS
ncbi:MAG TPA: phospholipase D-like domain-containing protein [Pyrinomonadaceae bacterium]|nr:phospholipase D-like domain-containing protein [Pyrinomonadaceae bacterium]